MKSRKNKIVVVTGASAGLGRAIVREFAQRGDDVALIARGTEGLTAAKKEVEDLGGRAMVLPLDVADAGALEQAAGQIEKEWGPIDIWVNNAMNSVFSPVTEMTPEDYKRVTEVTYLGQVYGALSALKRMRERNKGCVIFVGSALAYRGIPLQSAYCASKHAIQGFYDSLRTELLHEKSEVKICMVQLPAMNTTQFGFVKSRLPRKPKPMGKIYEPEVAARAIVWATEHHRREVLVGLPTVEAVVGNKIVPGYADWRLANTGFDGQMTDEPEDANRPNNLYEPIPGDHGAHGPFADQSSNFSPQLWFTENRGILAACVVGIGIGLVSLWFRK